MYYRVTAVLLQRLSAFAFVCASDFDISAQLTFRPWSGDGLDVTFAN